MRNSKLTPAEIEAAEMAAADRASNRKNGYTLMGERDSGIARLSNGIMVRWPHPETWSEEVNGISTMSPSIPQGTFMIDSKLYDADELQKYLRWV